MQAARRTLKALRKRYYLYTAAFRALPDFIIVGAMKSGTSTLFSYLRQHPQIIGSHKKEVHFFDRHYPEGSHWYRAHFPYSYNVRQGSITGEASPFYLLCPPIPERINALIPDVRLIALLRNPVDRAISHYFHSTRSGKETLPIMKALEAEEARTQDAWNRALQGDCAYDPHLTWFSYQQRGLYLEQLQRYWKVFNRENIYIESTDNLLNKPEATLADIFSFLGVMPGFRVPNTRKRNVGTNKSRVPADVYDYLNRYYRQPNEQLFTAIDRDFGWNSKTENTPGAVSLISGGS
jgi:hypothetical protein